MTDELKKLEAAVGDTKYGQFIIEEAKKAKADTGKYAQDIKDRLDEMIGTLKAYARIHRDAGKDAMATTEDDKIAIAEKAKKALED